MSSEALADFDTSCPVSFYRHLQKLNFSDLAEFATSASITVDFAPTRIDLIGSRRHASF